MRSRLLCGLAALALVSACSDDPVDPITGESITLTASQATSLVTTVESFSSTDPTLGALADTVEFVLKAGAEARRIEVTTDLGATTYYAISLYRASTKQTSKWSTFHVIAFDSPTAPQHFIILGGYSSSTTAAPQTASGPIGAGAISSLTAHLFRLSGSQLNAWHASAGTVSFNSMETTEQCSGSFGTQTCARGTMDATFAITGTVAGNGTTGQRTASGTVSAIPGVRLSF
jgi:hypothetical protein